MTRSQVTVVRIKADMLNEWLDLQRSEVVPALKKAGIKQRTVWATAVGNSFEYTILMPFDTWALMDAPGPLVTALGAEGAARLNAKLRKCIEVQRTFMSLQVDDVNIPFGILALILSYYVLADDSKRTQQRFDYIGAALLGGALVSILYSLTEGQHTGFGTPLTMGMFFGGFVVLALFIWWERRIDYPMLNLQFFSNHNFSLGLVAASLQALTLQFNFVLLPLFMQKVLNFDTGKTGLLMVVSPIAISIFSMVSGRLSDRFGPRWVATAGIFFLGLGLDRVSGLTAESDVWDIVFRVFFIGTGFGLFNSANTSSVMGNVPREHGGIANGVLSVVRSTGQIAGVTLGAFIWSTQIFAQTGQAYIDFGEAPQAALVGGFQTTMFIAACLCWLALIPTLIRRDTTPA